MGRFDERSGETSMERGGRGAHASDITAAQLSATLWRVSDHSEAKSLFAHYVRPFVRAADENGDARVSVLSAEINIARDVKNRLSSWND
jgi:hypothetical protein